MAHSITIPRLGWSMEEGTFCEWLKAPGEFVRAGEMIFMLEGEKAAQEIESLDSGYLSIPVDAPKPGAIVKVGETIGFLLAEGEPSPVSVRVDGLETVTALPDDTGVQRHETVSPTNSQPKNQARVAGPASRRLARRLGINLNAVRTPDPTGRVLTEDLLVAASGQMPARPIAKNGHKTVATPRARRRASELGIDWNDLKGSGRGGRVRERDVLSAIRVNKPGSVMEEQAPTTTGRHITASKLRRVIAQRMMAGCHAAAPVTIATKVNAQALVAHRHQLMQAASGGLVPSYNDILLVRVAQTLLERPGLNACWYRDGVYHYEEVHIATAVDTPEGLLAPVVRHADRHSYVEMAGQTKQLIELARSGQLKQEQLTGATFTVTNLGMFGIDAFTPILNLPQAAILGVGRIIEEPVVCNGRIVVGQTLTLSLTFDHRVIDGAPAARWLQRLCELISD